MSLKKLDEYKRRFLEGELSKTEESEFKKMLWESNRSEDVALQDYFHGVDKAGASSFTPITREQFFERVSERSRNKRRWYAACVAAIGVIVACTGLYSWRVQKAEQAAREEVDRSIETTRRALSTISIHINSSVEGVSRGMDFTRPLGVFSKLNNQFKSEEDANSDEIK